MVEPLASHTHCRRAFQHHVLADSIRVKKLVEPNHFLIEPNHFNLAQDDRIDGSEKQLQKLQSESEKLQAELKACMGAHLTAFHSHFVPTSFPFYSNLLHLFPFHSNLPHFIPKFPLFSIAKNGCNEMHQILTAMATATAAGMGAHLLKLELVLQKAREREREEREISI